MGLYVEVNDSRYPKLLKTISQAPKKLFYKGRWDESLFENCLAVVGSRKMTTYGRKTTEKLVFDVVSKGITIVSGFMYGIDAAAHLSALNGSGKTIAVMPCGIDLIHPQYQADIYERIVNGGGLIISEYDGKEQPQYWTYPRRNRIIAGLSKGVLVVEAALKSGSLITAGLAKEFNRELLAVPGQIDSLTSKGTLKLISEGAKMIKNSSDLLEVFGYHDGFFEKVGSNHKPVGAYSDTPQRAKIINLLNREPMNIDELSRETGINSANLGSEITIMTMIGEIFLEGGKYYVN